MDLFCFQDMLLQWEAIAKKSDQASRDRLLVLTMAAEKGWSVASDLAFRMKGNNWRGLDAAET